jgi:hypothetical protein
MPSQTANNISPPFKAITNLTTFRTFSQASMATIAQPIHFIEKQK